MRSIRKTFEEKADEGSRSKAGEPSSQGKEKIKITGKFIAAKGRPLRFSVVAEDGRRADAGGSQPVAEAITSPTTEEKILKQLKKTGGTDFVLEDCEIVLKGDLMIPVSEINRVRRTALERLESQK